MTVPLRNSRISLTVCLYIFCYEADKPVKTLTDIAALGQTATEPTPPRLLDQVRARIRVLHYSIRTEQAYVDWIKRYIQFFDKGHPRELAAPDAEQSLSRLASLLQSRLRFPRSMQCAHRSQTRMLPHSVLSSAESTTRIARFLRDLVTVLLAGGAAVFRVHPALARPRKSR